MLYFSDMPKQHREPRLIRRLQVDAKQLPFLRLPKSLIVALQWGKGDEIEIRLTGRGTLELRKVGRKAGSPPESDRDRHKRRRPDSARRSEDPQH